MSQLNRCLDECDRLRARVAELEAAVLSKQTLRAKAEDLDKARAEEREACAGICADAAALAKMVGDVHGWRITASCEQNIRARGDDVSRGEG